MPGILLQPLISKASKESLCHIEVSICEENPNKSITICVAKR